MSESVSKSVFQIPLRAFLIIVLVFASLCNLRGQNAVSSSRIDTLISIVRNSSSGKTQLPVLTVSPRLLRIYSGEGGISEIMIISNASWILKCTDKWITANTETGGGFNKIVFTVKENPEPFERIARINVTVKGLPVRIIELSQKARHDE